MSRKGKREKESIYSSRGIFAGEARNKIEEAKQFRRAVIRTLGREPNIIVTVSGQIHGGRGTDYLFRKEFPASRVISLFVPWQCEIGPTHGLLSLNKWAWFAANIAWYIILRLPFDLGYKILSQIEGMKHQD